MGKRGKRRPPTVESDSGESDYEHEPFGIGETVIYDEDTNDPLGGPKSMLWCPLGVDTDPVACLPGPSRDHLLPFPSRGDSIEGALPPEYGSKWPKPGHLFHMHAEAHLTGPMYKADNLNLNQSGDEATMLECARIMTLLRVAHRSVQNLTGGRLMLFYCAIEELGTRPCSESAWAFALQNDPDLGPRGPKDEYTNIPGYAAADLHHFESEYKGLDKEGWPGFSSHVQEHSRIRLKSTRLKKQDEAKYIQILAQEKARLEKVQRLPTPRKVPPAASRPKPAWEAPIPTERHINYDKWAKAVAPLYLVPHLNLEELRSPNRLLNFIHSRALMAPIHFQQQDFRGSYLGRALRILTGPFALAAVSWELESEMMKQGRVRANYRHVPYSILAWAQFQMREGDHCWHFKGDLWLGLKAQEFMYRFHHKLCLLLFDASGIKLEPKPDVAEYPELTVRDEDVAADAEEARRYMDRDHDNKPLNLLALSPFQSHVFCFEVEGRSGLVHHYFEEQLGSAAKHFEYLVTDPEYFHRHIQEAYDQHYTHLFPDLNESKGMDKQLFVDVLRDVFRKPLIDLELCHYLACGRRMLERGAKDMIERMAQLEKDLEEEKMSKEDYEFDCQRRKREFQACSFVMQYRGMIACLQYIAMITNRAIVPASKGLRRYFKCNPKFRPAQGKDGCVSNLRVVRYLPKRGSEGKVMKRTRKLRRTTLKFPKLDIELSEDGKKAVDTDETIRSIHMPLVEFLGKEELTSVVGLGNLIRKIGALVDRLDSGDERYRLIKKPAQELINNMAVIFLFIEQEGSLGSYLSNPPSTDPVDIANFAKSQEYWLYGEWTHNLHTVIRHRLDKLDEFPIENRIRDEIISELYTRHRHWVRRGGGAAATEDGGEAPRRRGSRKTADTLWEFWGELKAYLENERCIGEGKISKSVARTAEPPPPTHKQWTAGWNELHGLGSTMLRLVDLYTKWQVPNKLNAIIRQPGYEKFRESIRWMDFKDSLPYLPLLANSNPTVGQTTKASIQWFQVGLRDVVDDKADPSLSGPEGRKHQADVERWFKENEDHLCMMPHLLAGRLVERPLRDELFSESEDEEDEVFSMPGGGGEEEVAEGMGQEDIHMGVENLDIGRDDPQVGEADTVMGGVDPVPELAPEPQATPEPQPEPQPEPEPEHQPQPTPSRETSPDRHQREAALEIDAQRNAWLQNLDDDAWEEVSEKYGGSIDPKTSMRRTEREVRKNQRWRYLQSAAAPPAEAEAEAEKDEGGKGILKKTVVETLEAIFHYDSGALIPTPVTINAVREFMGAIGFSSAMGGGSGVTFQYDADAGLIPVGELKKRVLAIHQPHGPWGNKLEKVLLDLFRGKLVDCGVTYEVILKYYEPKR